MITKELLYQKYITEQKSTYKIAKEVGYSQSTIYYFLVNFKIPIRNRSEAQKGRMVLKKTRQKIGKSQKQRLASLSEEEEIIWKKNLKYNSRWKTAFPEQIAIWKKEASNRMREMRKINNKAAIETGKKRKGKTHKEIFGEKRANQFRKINSEKHTGKKAWNKDLTALTDDRLRNSACWQGGKSFEPYSPEFNEKLKVQIRERDGFVCQYPGCEISESKKALNVHHINYDKKDNQLKNLIALCDGHNMRVNFNRQKWQLYFEIIQELRFMHPNK